MIVVDASLVVDFLLGPGTPGSATLAERWVAQELVTAPYLVDVEAGQAIRRVVRSGALHEAEALELLDDLARLPIWRWPHEELLTRAFDFRDNVTMYDGIYLALAELLRVPLLTGDAGLREVPGCHARVEVVAADA